MIMRLIAMVLIAIALLSSATCLFTNDRSCAQFLETPHGKLAVVAVAILAASQHLLCGLAIAIVFVIFTNNDSREGLTGKAASDPWCQNMVKTYGEAAMSQPTYPSSFGIDAPDSTPNHPKSLWGADAQKTWKERCAPDPTAEQIPLWKQPAVKLAYRQKICDPRFAAYSAANQQAVSDMTKEMTMTFPLGPCNPCSQASTGCHFEITGAGADQLKAAQGIQPPVSNFGPASGWTSFDETH